MLVDSDDTNNAARRILNVSLKDARQTINAATLSQENGSTVGNNGYTESTLVQQAFKIHRNKFDKHSCHWCFVSAV